jgi:hypothetical protein
VVLKELEFAIGRYVLRRRHTLSSVLPVVWDYISTTIKFSSQDQEKKNLDSSHASGSDGKYSNGKYSSFLAAFVFLWTETRGLHGRLGSGY